jgi:hypothetical protein
LLKAFHVSSRQELLRKLDLESGPGVTNNELVHSGVALIGHRCIMQPSDAADRSVDSD